MAAHELLESCCFCLFLGTGTLSLEPYTCYVSAVSLSYMNSQPPGNVSVFSQA